VKEAAHAGDVIVVTVPEKSISRAGRPAAADEIAEAIVFLEKDRSSFVQEAKLAVDGGRTGV
jgi:NAD(P)-dependent dehydrogenase (short-subunit alcohol dehydrogenase family)